MAPDRAPSASSGQRPAIRAFGTSVAALWIFGGAAYYYVRFSMTFYEANRAAFEDLASRIGEAFGL